MKILDLEEKRRHKDKQQVRDRDRLLTLLEMVYQVHQMELLTDEHKDQLVDFTIGYEQRYCPLDTIADSVIMFTIEDDINYLDDAISKLNNKYPPY